jgi:hypothetical protein
VPISRIAQFIVEGEAEILKVVPAARLMAFGHVGDGNLHFNVSYPEGDDGKAFMARQTDMNRAVHDLVDSMGGSISAEHGLGMLRRDEAIRYRPAVETRLMRAIKQTLDPNTATIWNIYQILAEITAQQGETATAQNYRRLMRESYLAAPVCRHDLQRFIPLIEAIVDNWQDPEPVLAYLVENGGSELAQALARFQSGERNEDQLYQNLNYLHSAILHTVLSRLG